MELDRRNRKRRIKKAFMDHLAFVPDPAYVGAGVLSVRGAAVSAATPALDELVAWMQGRKQECTVQQSTVNRQELAEALAVAARETYRPS
jgi:hypothetical protein